MSARILEAGEDLHLGLLTLATPEQTLAQIGAVVDRDLSKPYTLLGAVVRRGVNAFNVNTVLDAQRAPASGIWVVNLFGQSGDQPQQTDGSGVARFQYGASSAFSNPGGGPFTVLLVEDPTKDDDPPKAVRYKSVLSERVRSLGDFQGTHTEIYLQWGERAAAPIADVPTIRTDDELRRFAYTRIYAERQAVSYNPDAALVKEARIHLLGVALASEGRYLDGAGNRLAWQPFAGGILRCIEGEWDKVQTVDW